MRDGIQVATLFSGVGKLEARERTGRGQGFESVGVKRGGCAGVEVFAVLDGCSEIAKKKTSGGRKKLSSALKAGQKGTLSIRSLGLNPSRW